jgi:hypothetical protein
MVKTWIRRAAAAVAGMAAAGGLLMAAAPANAVVVTGSICTANGNQYCLFTADFNYGTVVTSSTSARTVCGPQAGTTENVQLCGSNAPPDRCIYQNGSQQLVIGHCSGQIGSLWRNKDNGDGTRSFENNHYTIDYAAGDNVNGHQWASVPFGTNGWYYRMKPLM